MIPEAYVADLQLRLGLYRRLADLDEQRDIEAFAAELIDRFGPLPEEVQHLLEDRRRSRALCREGQCREGRRRAEGRRDQLPRQRLRQSGRALALITGEGSLAKVRPDQKVVFIRDWEDTAKRMKGTAALMILLARLAAEGEKAAA